MMLLMSDQLSFFEKARVDQEEARRQDSLFLLFTVILVFSEFYYGIRLYRVLEMRFGAVVLLLDGFALALNWIAWYFHRASRLARLVCSGLGIASSLVFFNVGGIAGTAFMWVIVFPSATFLLLGGKDGFRMNLLFAAALLAMQVAGATGQISWYYSTEQMVEIWSGFTMASIMGYVAFKALESFQNIVIAQSKNLRTLLQNLPLGVIVFDARTHGVLAVNAKATDLLIGLVDMTVSDEKVSNTYDFLVDTWKKRDEPKEESPMVLVSRRQDGTRSVLRISYAPIMDSAGAVSSEIVILEDAGKEYDLDKMRQEFISIAGHQLMTPLTGIKWSVEMLMSGDSGKLSPEQNVYVDRIAVITDKLSQLVGDLLNVSRIDSGRKFEVLLDKSDVVSIVRSAVKEVHSAASARRIALTIDLPAKLELNVDELKLQEVFMNLLSNSIKYSNDDGDIKIGFEAGADGMPTFSVSDHGIGIPISQHSRIFDKFFRADNAPEYSEGTGLGLYIAKAIVEKHGGKIWFESEVGQGSTFFVSLPKS